MRIVPLQLIVILSLPLLTACSQSPSAWWRSVNKKAEEMRKLEANHHALTLEHEELKRSYFRLEADYMEMRAKVESVKAGDLNLKATGTLMGRVPSSIVYEIPRNLRLEDQLQLAYEHFNEERFAEAAATFEDFLKKPESAALVDASALYAAGVSWFKLGNLHKARENFEAARASASGEQREKIHKKVDLWMRAIDRKSGG